MEQKHAVLSQKRSACFVLFMLMFFENLYKEKVTHPDIFLQYSEKGMQLLLFQIDKSFFAYAEYNDIRLGQSLCRERKKEVKGLFALQKFTFFALEIDM